MAGNTGQKKSHLFFITALLIPSTRSKASFLLFFSLVSLEPEVSMMKKKKKEKERKEELPLKVLTSLHPKRSAISKRRFRSSSSLSLPLSEMHLEHVAVSNVPRRFVFSFPSSIFSHSFPPSPLPPSNLSINLPSPPMFKKVGGGSRSRKRPQNGNEGRAIRGGGK